MKIRLYLKCLFAAGLVVSMTGCLTQRTVTEGGSTVKQKYVIKRPFSTPDPNSL